MRAPQKVWAGAFGRQGLLFEIVMIKQITVPERRSWEREVLIMPKLDFGLRKKAKAKALAGKGDTLWSVFPGICCGLDLVFEDPLLLIYFGVLIPLWPSFYVNHYAHEQDIARQHTHLFDLVSWILLCCFWSIQQCCFFAIDIHSSLICCYHAMPLPSVFSRLNT